MTAAGPAGFVRRHAAAIRLGLLVLVVGALLATGGRSAVPGVRGAPRRLDAPGPLGPPAFGADVAAVVLMAPGSA